MNGNDLIRVLVIVDDQGDFEMARAIIQSIESPSTEYEVGWVPSYAEALDAFDQRRHDVYIVDYSLEGHDGLELVREARRRGMREPLIMLTGRGSREVDVEVGKAGASDYLVKGKIDADRMERTIRYALERQRDEAALRDSEERHRSLFDHLPIGLYRVSPDGDFMDANPTLVRILGYPDAATLRERHAVNFYVGPADRNRFSSLLKEYGVARGFETTLELHDGSTVRVRNTARAHRSPDGTVRYFEGAVEEIAERRATERIQQRAERFDAVYQRSGLALLLVDLSGDLVEGNTAFQRAFGYNNAQIGGMALEQLAAPSDRDDVLDDLRELTEDRRDALNVERRFVGEDGAILWAQVKATLLRDATGEPDHVMLMLEQVAETGEEV